MATTDTSDNHHAEWPLSVLLFSMHYKCYLHFVVVRGGTLYNNFISFLLVY